MQKLGGVVGAELLSPTLVAQLSTMTLDAQWRVRMAIFELIGDLAISFGIEVT